MRTNRFLRALKFASFAVLFFALFGAVVMGLWNWLTPALFGWHTITFWQAIGLLLLSKILFGGFHGRRGWHPYWRRRMMERWAQMTPEEREKFRQGMRGRCGSFAPAAAEPKA
jgi:hypothetical protein